MRRREFILLVGTTTAVWPLTGRAQQSSMQVVGFLRSTPFQPSRHLVAAFREGLSEAGFVEGQNLTIEYRWADNHLDRLPGLAADLVHRQVAVIVGNGLAMQAAKATTATIPIVFVFEHDPIRSGLVASLSRPGGNVTGVTFSVDGSLDVKRLEQLHELAPKAGVMAVLLDPNALDSEGTLRNLEAAGRALGLQIVAVKVASERDLDAAFARIVEAGAGAVLVSGSPFFNSQGPALVALAARHAIPASYFLRSYVEAGGLMSYGASISGAYREAGIYVGRILKGEKPADLPVLQATTLELVINLKTAKGFGLTVPPSLLARADEVIE
jgi:putative tryptophan/tyrosine transport system substrate-binding protein